MKISFSHLAYKSATHAFSLRNILVPHHEDAPLPSFDNQSGEITESIPASIAPLSKEDSINADLTNVMSNDLLHKKIPDDVHANLQDFALSVAGMNEGFMTIDEQERIVLCNEAICRIFRLSFSPLGRLFSDVFGENSDCLGVSYCEHFYHYMLHGPHPTSSEQTLYRHNADGQIQKTSCYILYLNYDTGLQNLRFCIIKDVSDLSSCEALITERQAQLERSLQEQNRELMRANAQLRIENAERSAVAQALRRAEARYRDIFDNATEGIFQWTPDWRLVSANMSFARMLGYSTVNALFLRVAEGSFHFCYSPTVEKDLVAELERKGLISNFEFQVVRRDGTQLWASMNARRVVGPGGYTNYYEAFIENISSRKLTEEKLVYQAFHDPLTGLANRALFHDRLRMAIRRASRQPNYSFAVLYLDLDRFKMVNDSFGHNTGDDVLCHAAVGILSCVREVDTVARFGGDEFAVLIEEMERGSFAVRVAKRIHAVLSQPFMVKEQEINIGASIGIVLRAENYELPEDLLRDADTAMYRAKADRGICFKVFSQKMRDETIESIVFETDLRQGLKTEEFHVEYQPVVYMDNGSLYGFEALLRWNRKGEVVSPAYFIPVAEETGLIKNLGLHMIESVCSQVVAWQKECNVPFVTHLNISGRQLIVPSFPRDVEKILEKTGVDPSTVLFEITESVLLDNGGACIQGIHQIRELGVQFCLDDFGTGFSSLSYLRQLPLSCIKIDRSFVSEVETDPHALVIVRNLLSLGQDLGLSVIVEGIERNSQVEALIASGCTLAQGFYFHRPLPVERATELLI
ncbi:EAL domain-containing protein [Desulfovibrio sp. OttesenSCG-928-M14]|nr:EAL domain-containing protein [Desulfovibrio sp. OttesenSCG-928-M14]